MQILNGKARVGLICSGGGAKSFFHLGFLEQLARCGIGPDAFDSLLGVSGGALALYPFVCKVEMSEIVDFAKRRFAARKWASRIPGAGAVHLLGLLRRTLNRELSKILPTRPLESLSPRLVVMSFDVLSRQPFLHLEGDALQAIVASMAIPIFSRPVRLGNRLLIDGGAWCSLPACEMRKHLPVHQVLGVDVSGPSLSVRRPKTNPGPLGMALRTWESHKCAMEQRQRRACDLLVAPDLSSFKFSDFTPSALAQLIRLGKRSAELAMPKIEAMLAVKGGPVPLPSEQRKQRSSAVRRTLPFTETAKRDFHVQPTPVRKGLH